MLKKLFVLTCGIVLYGTVATAYYNHPLSPSDHAIVTRTVDKIDTGLDADTRAHYVEAIRAYAQEQLTNRRQQEIYLQIADELSYHHLIRGYAIAEQPTPMMNRHSLAEIRGGADTETSQYGLLLDEYNTIDPTDMVALPGTVMPILDAKKDTDGNTMLRVNTREYPTGGEGLWIDRRLVRVTKNKPPERTITLPSKAEVIQRMKQAVGTPYVRGGNYYQGITSLATHYPIPADATDFVRQQRQLQGVDCSGLPYQATNGYTPRNTRLIMHMGEAVDIKNKTPDQLAAILQPLDFIVWPGHVMVVIDNQQVIESRHDRDKETEGYKGGTRIITITEALRSVFEESERIPVNDYNDLSIPEDQKVFLVRRWYNKQ